MYKQLKLLLLRLPCMIGHRPLAHLAHGSDRNSALARMSTALDEIVIDGIDTNISLHQWILRDPAFVIGATGIHFLEAKLNE